MAEDLPPESRLYIKEEIEKVRNHFKEEVENVKSYVTKTLTTVVIVVGLLTGLGVYGLASNYIDKTIQDWAEKTGDAAMKKKVEDAEVLLSFINSQADESKEIVAAMNNHTHSISIVGKRNSTGYLKREVKIPEGNVITGVYQDSGGLIFYSKSLKIENFHSP